eukprot:scaffold4958_cov406-Prasinococcus_capsulatus_cf.AAC.22
MDGGKSPSSSSCNGLCSAALRTGSGGFAGEGPGGELLRSFRTTAVVETKERPIWRPLRPSLAPSGARSVAPLLACLSGRASRMADWEVRCAAFAYGEPIACDETLDLGWEPAPKSWSRCVFKASTLSPGLAAAAVPARARSVLVHGVLVLQHRSAGAPSVGIGRRGDAVAIVIVGTPQAIAAGRATLTGACAPHRECALVGCHVSGPGWCVRSQPGAVQAVVPCRLRLGELLVLALLLLEVRVHTGPVERRRGPGLLSPLWGRRSDGRLGLLRAHVPARHHTRHK